MEHSKKIKKIIILSRNLGNCEEYSIKREYTEILPQKPTITANSKKYLFITKFLSKAIDYMHK